MNQLKNILSLLLFSLTLASCGQTETRIKADEVRESQQIEKKYAAVISDSTNILSDKIETLELEYTIWGCACPQWIQSKDNERNDTTKNYLKLHFYIEPADKSLELPIYFDANRHRIKVTGQFYQREDYPQGTVEMEEPMPKARVFRYTKLDVMDRPNFKADSKIETLILNYDALSCTCAQWSSTQKSNESEAEQNYWLEPAHKNLIRADTLFNGKNLPGQIKVTGQIVTKNGFPKVDLTKVDWNDAGKVFRYTDIEVLQGGETRNRE